MGDITPQNTIMTSMDYIFNPSRLMSVIVNKNVSNTINSPQVK